MNGASTIRACLTTTTGFAAVLRAAAGASRSSERSSSLWLWLQLRLRRLESLLRRRFSPPTAPSPSSSCPVSSRPRTPTAVRSACSYLERVRPSPASGRSPPSCAAGSSRRSSISTGRRRSGSRTARPPPPSSSPCHHQGHITTSRAIPSRSSGLATAACSPRGRRGSTGSSRSRTSRPLRTRSRRERRRRSAPEPTAARPRPSPVSTCGSHAPTMPAQAQRWCSSAGSSRSRHSVSSPAGQWRAVPPCSSLRLRSPRRLSSARSASTSRRP